MPVLVGKCPNDYVQVDRLAQSEVGPTDTCDNRRKFDRQLERGLHAALLDAAGEPAALYVSHRWLRAKRVNG